MTLPIWILKIGGFLKAIPWPIYAAIALVAAFFFWGDYQHERGRDVVLTELRKAEAQAKAKRRAAIIESDAKAKDRAKEFGAQQDILQETIENAQETDSNPLDALFGELRRDD
jgi:Flp pilus assembly protein TadB